MLAEHLHPAAFEPVVAAGPALSRGLATSAFHSGSLMAAALRTGRVGHRTGGKVQVSLGCMPGKGLGKGLPRRWLAAPQHPPAA